MKILLVDDHPLILDGYKNILTSLDLKLVIDTANNCEEAFLKVKNSVTSIPYDVVFLDVSLPPSKTSGIYSGEDLGLKIREISPQSRIVVLTMYNENRRIYNLMKNLEPEGLLIKSDVTPSELIIAFQKIISGNYYYSQTVNQLLRRQLTNDFILDDIDRSILFNISKGVKTKDLSDIVNLSLAAVEKRKRNMKELLGVDQGGDLVLIDKAKELGFL